MKWIIKLLLRGIGMLLAPLHRPISSRLDAYLRRMIAEALQGQAARVEAALKHELCEGELGCTLDGVIQELMRLELQVETIAARREANAIPADPAADVGDSSSSTRYRV